MSDWLILGIGSPGSSLYRGADNNLEYVYTFFLNNHYRDIAVTEQELRKKVFRKTVEKAWKKAVKFPGAMNFRVEAVNFII